MGVYISFYKVLPININNKRQVNVIRQLLINKWLHFINTPVIYKDSYRCRQSYVDELEAARLSSISVKRDIKWLRKATCKQVISKCYQVDMHQFANTLYTNLQDLYFPIGKYIHEDKYVISFKDANSCLTFITSFGILVEAEDELFIRQFFNKYDKKGLIEIH